LHDNLRDSTRRENNENAGNAVNFLPPITRNAFKIED